jgi:hypothetical protein
MKTEVLKPTDDRLYSLICKLVVNPAVLRQNDNVAFKVTPNAVWFVATDDNDTCVGFLPSAKKGTITEINNYYIKDRDVKVFSTLLSLAARAAKKEGQKSLIIIAQEQDWALLKRLKYRVEKQFVKYARYEKVLS